MNEPPRNMAATGAALSARHTAPRAVLFDAVGTVMRPEPSVAKAYALAGRRHGVDLPEDEIQRRFRGALVRQDELDRVRHAGRTDQAREIDRWRGIVDDVFGPTPYVEPIFDDLWEHFAAPANWRLFDDAADTWHALAAQGLTLGIVSNFDDRLEPICQTLAPLTECTNLFISSRVGWRKPHAQLFAAVAEQLQLAPHEILLVGDDLENDYRAARAAGWQALLLDRDSEAAGNGVPLEQARHTISSLAELVERFLIAG
jgi:putative hydrolase of the HAD superfamily